MSAKRTLLSLICVKITIVMSAPLLQVLQPYQRIPMQTSQQNLQQQLLELQSIQQLHPMPPFLHNQLQPFIIVLPDQSLNSNFNKEINERVENELNIDNGKTKTKGGDEDSIVIDAEPIPILEESIPILAEPIPILEEQKAFLVIPNGRLSLGDLISAIPFLPIEINVPDTISWIYNGISGIISIIGSRLPFQRPQENSPIENVNLKAVIDVLQMKNRNNIRPIIMMPLSGLSGPISPY